MNSEKKHGRYPWKSSILDKYEEGKLGIRGTDWNIFSSKIGNGKTTNIQACITKDEKIVSSVELDLASLLLLRDTADGLIEELMKEHEEFSRS